MRNLSKSLYLFSLNFLSDLYHTSPHTYYKNQLVQVFQKNQFLLACPGLVKFYGEEAIQVGRTKFDGLDKRLKKEVTLKVKYREQIEVSQSLGLLYLKGHLDLGPSQKDPIYLLRGKRCHICGRSAIAL